MEGLVFLGGREESEGPLVGGRDKCPTSHISIETVVVIASVFVWSLRDESQYQPLGVSPLHCVEAGRREQPQGAMRSTAAGSTGPRDVATTPPVIAGPFLSKSRKPPSIRSYVSVAADPVGQCSKPQPLSLRFGVLQPDAFVVYEARSHTGQQLARQMPLAAARQWMRRGSLWTAASGEPDDSIRSDRSQRGPPCRAAAKGSRVAWPASLSTTFGELTQGHRDECPFAATPLLVQPVDSSSDATRETGWGGRKSQISEVRGSAGTTQLRRSYWEQQPCCARSTASYRAALHQDRGGEQER